MSEVPPPTLTPVAMLVDVRASCSERRTERSRMAAGARGASRQGASPPDEARQVLDKARHDGLRDTMTRSAPGSTSRRHWATRLPASSCRLAGAFAVFAPGDRVACGGGDYAVHAGSCQFRATCASRLPDGVAVRGGSLRTVASVAMHGVRQADARHRGGGGGDRPGVDGAAHRPDSCDAAGATSGHRPVASLVEKARQPRLDRHRLPPRALSALERIPSGVSRPDAVIVTASTALGDPIDLAVRLLRDRGRVVSWGRPGRGSARACYGREVDIRFSRSYGPGRYDREYRGTRPRLSIGYVRWTEQPQHGGVPRAGRPSGRIDLTGLISERMPSSGRPSVRPSALGGGIRRSGACWPIRERRGPRRRRPTTPSVPPGRRRRHPRVNVIGAGSFGQRILIRGSLEDRARSRRVASAKGLSAKAAADRFGFVGVPRRRTRRSGTPTRRSIAIATRHGSHAALAEAALTRRQGVFVEKPPCLTSDGAQALAAAAAGRPPAVVGFNRRHAPFALALRDHVREPGDANRTSV